MLPRSTQGKLALYLGAMVALQCYVLWQARQSIPQGLPDFSIFYTAGRITTDGNGSRLYDDTLQESVQRSFSPRALERRGSILPYNHPPFEALLFVPVVHFSYLTAYAIWLGVNLVLLFSIPFLLRPHLTALARLPLYLWLLGCLAFYPVFVGLIQGQDSVLLLFLYSLAFVGLERGSGLSAGSWLGLGLFKYHLVLPFVVSCWRRRRLIAAFLSVAAILAVISLAVTGWQSLRGYPRYVWATEHDAKYVWNSPHGNTANLRGLISAVVPLTHPHIRTLLIVFFSATVLLLMIYTAGKTSLASSRQRQAMFALSLLGTALVSYHIYVHDLSILFLSLLLVSELLLSDPPLTRSTKRVLYACMAVLLCSPLYIVLTLRYRQLQIMALVLLVVFLELLAVLRSLWTQPSAKVSLPASAGK